VRAAILFAAFGYELLIGSRTNTVVPPAGGHSMAI
jgi:hypothetical protein